MTDPDTGEVRYIGQSTRGLARPKRHSCPSSLVAKNYKNSWVKSLLARGLIYKIIILEAVISADLLGDAEQRWIAFGKRSGWRLTNLTDGGPGPSGFKGRIGHKVSKATREKLRRALTGRKHTPESLAKMQRLFGSSEMRLKNRLSHLGQKHTRRTRKQMSASATGKHQGSLNQCARLTEDQVVHIRKVFASGGVVQRELAERYDVSIMTISCIVNRVTWKHV